MGSFATYPSLEDKVVFVTGGGSGIGASIVSNFARQGSKVHFCDISEDCSQELVKELEKCCRHTPVFHNVDLMDVPALQRTISKIGEEQGLDVLVNNAANDQRHKLEDITPEYFDDRIAINLRHQLFAAQSAAKIMKASGSGNIINIGSLTYMIGQGGMACYSAAKSAVWGLTRSLATDLGEFGIRVNMIVPGWIITQRQEELWLTPESEKELLTKQSVKRKLRADDVARVVLFYASDDSSACTAQAYVVDGGWL